MSKPPKASRTVGSARQKPAKSFAGFLPFVRLNARYSLCAGLRFARCVSFYARAHYACVRPRLPWQYRSPATGAPCAVCRVVALTHSATAAARKTCFSLRLFSRFAVNCQFNAMGIEKWSVSAPLPLHY